MSFSEKIDEWRESAIVLGNRLGQRFLPDLMPPPARGDHKEAAELLEQGRKRYNRKAYSDAEEYFRRAVAADESYAKAHYYLGLALYKNDDSTAALKAWQRATEVRPNDPVAYKAERKIRYVKRHVDRTVNELANRLRKK